MGPFRSLVRVAALSVVFGAGIVRAQTDTSVLRLDLDAAVKLALDSNYQVRIARAGEVIAAAEVKQATSAVWPHLSITANYTRNIKKPVTWFELGGELQPVTIGSNNLTVASINLRQRIFDDGQFGTHKARQIANLYAEATHQDTRRSEADVVLAVSRLFYGVLLAHDVVDVLKESLAQSESHYRNVKAQFEQGVASEFDLLRSEVEVAEARPAVIEAENDLRLVRQRLNQALGLPPAQTVELVGELAYRPLPQDEIERRSTLSGDSRPELVQLRLHAEMARLNVNLEKDRRWPSLYLTGSYQFQAQSNDFSYGPRARNTSLFAGFDLSFDLFDGFRRSAEIQKAEGQARQIDAQLAAAKQVVEVEILEATLNMREAAERVDVQRTSVARAQKAYDIATVRYEKGVGTQLELLDAHLALNRVQLSALRATYDYNIALFEWERAIASGREPSS